MAKKSAHTKYYVNKKKVASVTTIIGNNLGWNKGALIGWSRKMALSGQDPNVIKKEAASIGTLTHKMVENYILEKPINTFIYSEEDIAKATVGFKAFLDWEKIVKPIYLNTEIQLVSKEFLYGGTIDLIVDVAGHIGILDLKTSNNIYKEHIIQLAAYRNLYTENHGPVDYCAILKLDKVTGKFTYHFITNEKLDKAFEAFEYCLKLSQLKEEL